MRILPVNTSYNRHTYLNKSKNMSGVQNHSGVSFNGVREEILELGIKTARANGVEQRKLYSRLVKKGLQEAERLYNEIRDSSPLQERVQETGRVVLKLENGAYIQLNKNSKGAKAADGIRSAGLPSDLKKVDRFSVIFDENNKMFFQKYSDGSSEFSLRGENYVPILEIHKIGNGEKSIFDTYVA